MKLNIFKKSYIATFMSFDDGKIVWVAAKEIRAYSYWAAHEKAKKYQDSLGEPEGVLQKRSFWLSDKIL